MVKPINFVPNSRTSMAIYTKKNIGKNGLLGVWQITESETALLNALSLTPNELTTVNSFKSTQRKRQWLATRLLLKNLANTTTIHHHESGKPYLEHGFPFISISHSHDYVAILLHHEKAVGIDIQLIADKILKIKDRFLNSKEQECYQQSGNGLEYLHRIWCAKEALYKIHGNRLIFFKEHLFVQDFNSENNFLEGTIEYQYINEKYTLGCEKLNDYMLVYVID